MHSLDHGMNEPARSYVAGSHPEGRRTVKYLCFGYNYDPSVESEAMQRESPSTPMSNQLTRRDFAIRTAGFGLAGFGLAMRLAPAVTLADARQASRSETSPAVADPYSLVDPELLPVLKQFPAYDLSAEMVGKFRQLPGMPPLPAPASQPVERHIPGPPGAPEVRLWIVNPGVVEVRELYHSAAFPTNCAGAGILQGLPSSLATKPWG